MNSKPRKKRLPLAPPDTIESLLREVRKVAICCDKIEAFNLREIARKIFPEFLWPILGGIAARTGSSLMAPKKKKARPKK
jgi:hypothetical protein